jgi:hypothetical protein
VGEQVCRMQNHECLIHHDNAPVQTALSIQEFLVTINKTCLIWPFAVSSSFKNETAAIQLKFRNNHSPSYLGCLNFSSISISSGAEILDPLHKL